MGEFWRQAILDTTVGILADTSVHPEVLQFLNKLINENFDCSRSPLAFSYHDDVLTNIEYHTCDEFL
ncbi:MAG: hypothetical protein M3146_02140 [Thermoproteota archaeon]|nr:hypothetical protein [Thermoproteota archaeon]